MEDTMSSYSFSHQFYQRWTCAPEPIRAAITQELKDITTLLQTETPFESFVFSTHDLDAHLDNLYENHDAEQAIAKAIADKQAQARATAEKERLEEQQKIQAAEEAKRKAEAKIEQETRLREEAEAAQQAPQKNEPLAADKNSSDKNNLDAKTSITHANDTSKVTAPSVDNVDKVDKVDNSADSNAAKAQPTEPSNAVKADVNNNSNASSENKTVSEHANVISGNAISDSHIANDKRIKEDSSIKTINDKASAAIKLALKGAKLNTTHQELIRELEMQIDDYLSEQMMLMSENLKSWLRAEMTQNLSEDKVETNIESQKN